MAKSYVESLRQRVDHWRATLKLKNNARIVPEVAGDKVAIVMFDAGTGAPVIEFMTAEEAATARKDLKRSIRDRWDYENTCVNLCLKQGPERLRASMVDWPEKRAASIAELERARQELEAAEKAYADAVASASADAAVGGAGSARGARAAKASSSGGTSSGGSAYTGKAGASSSSSGAARASSCG